MSAFEWLATLVQILILKHEKLNLTYICFGFYSVIAPCDIMLNNKRSSSKYHNSHYLLNIEDS
jgi:hypothetical protein